MRNMLNMISSRLTAGKDLVLVGSEGRLCPDSGAQSPARRLSGFRL